MTSLKSYVTGIYNLRKILSSICEGPGRIWIGLETRYPGEPYRFDGLKRPIASPSGREVIFQYTLSGEGRYTEDTREWTVPQGSAFFACIPSAHVYRMPETGTRPWTFFFMIIEHPYVTRRLAELNRRRGPVVPLTKPETTASVDLFKATCESRFTDDIDQEQALIDWWMTLERAARRTTASPGQRLLAEVEAYTRDNLERSFGIEELATSWRMSRSHFSHHFKRLTGRSPASVVLNTRIAEATRLLADSTDTLAAIAAATGFADANHFGKTFRRIRGLTPGQFRQTRGPRQTSPPARR